MLAPSHRLVKSIEAGINMVTIGRTRKDQANTELDPRKATIFLLCLPSFLPWVLLQALPLTQPLADHPSHSPVASSSCTQSCPCSDLSATKQCTGTGGPSSQLKLIICNIFFLGGGVWSIEHVSLQEEIWCEILHSDISKGGTSSMGQAQGFCAILCSLLLPLLWPGNSRCPFSDLTVTVYTLDLNFIKMDKQWRSRIWAIKRRLFSTPIPQRTLTFNYLYLVHKKYP